MKNSKNTPATPTFTAYMDAILSRTTCKRHNVPEDIPCWSFISSSGDILRSVCDKRARRAGLVGLPVARKS